MSEPFLGEIKLFSFARVPSGWTVCDGKELQIAQNQALFSLIRTIYGGDGQKTFRVPDLRGRVAVGAQKSGSYPLGSKGGQTSVSLTITQFPSHSHSLNASTAPGDTSGVANGVYGSVASPSPQNIYAPPSNPPVALAANALQATGGGGGHDNMQPYLVGQYCIATQGIYPAQP